MAAAAVEVPFVSSAYNIPQDKVEGLLTSPSVEAVKELFDKLVSKAKEHEKLKSANLKAEVELENVHRNNETKTRSLRANLDRVSKESESLKKQISEQEARCTTLQVELESTKSSTSKNNAHTVTLQSRISTLESTNRDTLTLVEVKSAQIDNLAAELQEAHLKSSNLKADVNSLELKLQDAGNASLSAKFREQALQQEIDLLKKHNQWFEVELSTKSAEHAKYRKDKNTRIAELQRFKEDAINTIDSFKRTEVNLRGRIEELMRKADSALAQVQQLQEAATNSEVSFKYELESAQRLADLQKQSADTARARLQDVQNMLESVKEDAAVEVGQLQAELETERSERQVSEQRVTTLEMQIERLETTFISAEDKGSIPSTPKPSINGLSVHNPSPDASIINTPRQRGGLNFTQLYSEHVQTKSDLEAERRRNQKLSSTIDDMINNLERRQPEIEELRVDHDRLQDEVTELSSLLQEASQDREIILKKLRSWEGQVDGLRRENNVLRQQLRDLSAQVKILLVEMRAQEEGIEALGPDEQLQLQRAARGEIPLDDVNETSDTGRFISQRLTIFRNVAELQEQNMNLLRVTRELGEKMEGEEARAKQDEQEQERAELAQLRERIERHQDEMKSMVTQSQSYIRERDMFRRMLAHRGQLPDNADLASIFAQSISNNEPPITPSRNIADSEHVNQSPQSKELADYAKLLKDMQSHFDSYRNEAASDHKLLKEQLDRTSKEKSSLQGDMARLNSHLTLAHERYEMIQANYAMVQTENLELQKRTRTLAEVAAKQDIRTQQAAEDLVEAKALLDSSRNEMANLKAERALWKNIESRMSEDNQQLLEERSRLNKMLSDLQNLQNERELSDSEARRRLQARIDTLESELQNIRRRLENEQEESKRTALRRDYEKEQSSNRIDDLIASLGKAREELVSARTKRDLLQSALDEMKVELNSNEEKLKNYQSKVESAVNGREPTTSGSELSITPESSNQNSELQKKLEIAINDLQAAKEHMHQYKAISQATEEELCNLNESADQYRNDTDKLLSEKDHTISDLRERVDEILSELSNTNKELSTLRKHQEDSSAAANVQKQSLEMEINRLKGDCERYAEAMKLHQQDLKAQAGIAQQAQQSYEDELLKHAEAAKALQQIRSEYNELKTQVAEIRTESQSAKSILIQSEESWFESKQRYEKELVELKERRESVVAQNKLLHGQLEKVSAQISELKQKRRLEEGTEFAVADSGTDALNEVIRYLRREKDIIEVQHELSVQEAKRFKQQLDHAQLSLDQVRETLAQERRSQNNREQEAASHTKLLQTINELNLFRESSSALRHEARQAQSRLEEKSSEVSILNSRLQPLEARVQQLEGEVEAKEGEIALLLEDRDRWQQRTQNILQKYDRVDPAEMEALKSQLHSLESEKADWQASKQNLEREIGSLADKIRAAEDAVREEEKKSYTERKDRLVEQFKSRSKELSAKNQSVVKEKAAIAEELNTVRGELERSNEEQSRLKVLIQERDQSIAESINATRVEKPSSEALVTTQTDEASLRIEESNDLQEKLRFADERTKNYEHEVMALKTRVNDLEAEVADRNQEIHSLSTQITQLRKLSSSNSKISNSASPTVGNLAAQDKIVPSEATGSSSSGEILDESERLMENQIEERVAVLQTDLNEKYAERVRQAEEQYQKRTDQMRSQLSTKLREGKESIRQELQKEHEEAIKSLRVGHDQEITSLRSEYEAKIESLKNTIPITKGSSASDKNKALSSAEMPVSVKEESQSLTWPKSEGEVKDFIAKNPTAKGILIKNVQAKLNQEREVIALKVREEQEKANAILIEDLQRKADQAKEQAVIMEGKRYSVKLSMAENKSRQAIAKIEVIEKAAKDTPQRPVVEVWAIAKDTKAPPPQAASNVTHTKSIPGTTPSVGSAMVQVAASASNSKGLTASKQIIQPNEKYMHHGSQSQSQTQPSVAENQTIASETQSDEATMMPPLSVSTTPNSSHPLPSKPSPLVSKPNQVALSKGAAGDEAAVESQKASSAHGQSAIPRGGGMVARSGRGRGGISSPQIQSQPGAHNTPFQTGLPRGQSSLPRSGGRGRGQGRGQVSIQASDAQQISSQVSPVTGSGRGVNPVAKQFVPGTAKRSREDLGDAGEGTNIGKRARSSGNEI